MDWFIELLGGTGVAHSIFIYSFVIAIGVILGKVKVLGVSLGATFVLFVGIACGHFGAAIDGNTLKFIQEFGLILFIFSIGLQVGPSFFSSFKEGGLLLNGLALSIIGLNIVVALAIFFITGTLKPNEIVGIFSGAITNTPGLGAAQQTLIETQGADIAKPLNEAMSMGYAAAYPLGVVGIILSMIILKAIFRVDLDEDSVAIDNDNKQSLLKPHMATYKVTNKLIFNRSVKRLHDIIDRNFVISRILKPTGEIIIPMENSIVEENDIVLMVISVQDEEVFNSVIGQPIEMEWEMDKGPVVSRRILVTKSEFSGRKIGSLRLPKGFGLNATRVTRAGLDLLPHHRGGTTRRHRPPCRKTGQLGKELESPQHFHYFHRHFLGYLLGFNSHLAPRHDSAHEAWFGWWPAHCGYLAQSLWLQGETGDLYLIVGQPHVARNWHLPFPRLGGSCRWWQLCHYRV